MQLLCPPADMFELPVVLVLTLLPGFFVVPDLLKFVTFAIKSFTDVDLESIVVSDNTSQNVNIV